jgi:hypothetical protein
MKDNPKTVDTQSTWKPKFPCMICEEEHYTKDFPHREVVTKFIKGASQQVQQQNTGFVKFCPSARRKRMSFPPWGCFHEHL